MVVLLRIVKGYGGYALDRLQALGQRLRLRIGEVGRHDLSGTEGGKLALHHAQPLTGLSRVRQKRRNGIFHADPAAGDRRKGDRQRKQQEE